MFTPAVRAHENHIRGATGPAMLKRVVEDDHVTPGPLRIVGAGETIGRDDDWNPRVEGTMDERFVLAIAPKDDRGLRAGMLQTAGEVRGERRLPGAPDREVPDAQRRNSRRVHRENA
jgi:hypothetical protein